MKKKFYMASNFASLDPQDLKPGYRILQIIGDFSFKSPIMDGPYESIAQLKKRSKIYKEALTKEPKRIQKILNPENITKITDFAITKQNNPKSKNYLQTIEHVIKGDIKNKNLYGIHFYDEKRMHIIEITGEEDLNKIWRAVVEICDSKNGASYTKETDFFPKDWDLTRLFWECEFAYKNKKKNSIKEFVYEGHTSSGIPVEIVIKNGILKTIYPVYQGRK